MYKVYCMCVSVARHVKASSGVLVLMIELVRHAESIPRVSGPNKFTVRATKDKQAPTTIEAQALTLSPPGMYATTLLPLLSCTLATLRLALLGFLGVAM